MKFSAIIVDFEPGISPPWDRSRRTLKITIGVIRPSYSDINELKSMMIQGRPLDISLALAADPFCPRHGRESRRIEIPGLRCDCCQPREDM